MPGYLPAQTGAATRSVRRMRGIGRVKLPTPVWWLIAAWACALGALQYVLGRAAEPATMAWGAGPGPLWTLGYILGMGYIIGLGTGSVLLVTAWEVTKRDPAWLRSVRGPRALSRRGRRVGVHSRVKP